MGRECWDCVGDEGARERIDAPLAARAVGDQGVCANKAVGEPEELSLLLFRAFVERCPQDVLGEVQRGAVGVDEELGDVENGRFGEEESSGREVRRRPEREAVGRVREELQGWGRRGVVKGGHCAQREAKDSAARQQGEGGIHSPTTSSR